MNVDVSHTLIALKFSLKERRLSEASENIYYFEEVWLTYSDNCSGKRVRNETFKNEITEPLAHSIESVDVAGGLFDAVCRYWLFALYLC